MHLSGVFTPLYCVAHSCLWCVFTPLYCAVHACAWCVYCAVHVCGVCIVQYMRVRVYVCIVRYTHACVVFSIRPVLCSPQRDDWGSQS